MARTAHLHMSRCPQRPSRCLFEFPDQIKQSLWPKTAQGQDPTFVDVEAVLGFLLSVHQRINLLANGGYCQGRFGRNCVDDFIFPAAPVLVFYPFSPLLVLRSTDKTQFCFPPTFDTGVGLSSTARYSCSSPAKKADCSPQQGRSLSSIRLAKRC